jgi:hypothetical protein
MSSEFCPHCGRPWGLCECSVDTIYKEHPKKKEFSLNLIRPWNWVKANKAKTLMIIVVIIVVIWCLVNGSWNTIPVE